jgi:hypothetical protein
MEAAAVATRADARTGIARWASLGGALYVVLFVVGVSVMFSGVPDSSSAPAKVIQWFSDGGNRDRENIGWVLVGLAVFFLLWFIAALRRAVAELDSEGILTTLVTIGGGVYAALALVAVSLEVGVRTMSDDTYQHRVYPELIHAVDDAGWMIHAAGAAGMGLMIIAASIAFMRGIWPGWAGWLGVIVGVLSLASIVFFPQFLFLAWVLVVSVLMFLRPDRYTGASAR